MAEKKIADGTVRADETEFQSDTTGNDPLRGTRHLTQESGLVDQDENLKEALANGGRSPQADYGTRLDPRAEEEKSAGAAPENKAASKRARR